MGKTITCPYCGAECEESMKKCPYCESTLEVGAERDYMNQLEQVRTNLENVEYGSDEAVKKDAKKLVKTILIVMVIAVLLTGCPMLLEKMIRDDDGGSFRAEYAWKSEHYPVLDQLYEDGQYDELLEKYEVFLTEKNHNLYDWEHNDFCIIYRELRSAEKILESEAALPANETLSRYDFIDLMEYEMAAKIAIKERDKYDEQEYEKLSPLIDKLEQDFDSRWHMTAEEWAVFEEKINQEYPGIPYSECNEFVTKWLEEK